jgi:hypothetical protein
MLVMRPVVHANRQHPSTITTTERERSVEVVAEMSPYPIVDMVVIDLATTYGTRQGCRLNWPQAGIAPKAWQK